MNILIVDDDKNILNQVVFLLNSWGYEAESLIDSRYLMEMLENFHPELILLDINMPDPNGLSLLKQIKKHPVHHTISVIMLTADDQPDMLETCLKLGASDYINKPLHEVILHARIQAFLTHLQQESQLRQSQRMKAMRTLSGGLAHDFNNILFAVLGNTELLKKHIKDDLQGQKYLKNIHQSTERAIKVVKQLQTFFSTQEHLLIPTQIQPILKDVLSFLRITLPANIEIQEHIEQTSPHILADGTQLYQALINICLNAKDAMEDNGGTLTLTMSPFYCETAPVSLPELKQGYYLHLSIRDTGRGMNHEVKERIFDPFFTTKGMGGIDMGHPSKEGTGLGLYVVHNIMQQHQGAIEVQSEPGRGSAFHLYFPALEEVVKPVEEKPSERPIAVVGSSQKKFRILVAEDEPLLASFYIQVLKQEGHQTTLCDNGQQALETFRKNPNQFDLILTDQEMPKLKGTQLSQELLKIRPDLPIILATGYSLQDYEKICADLGIRKFLLKPMEIKELLQTIQGL
ncbi:response regulator [Deltaproteobacteria bacterium TL4]